MSAYPHVVRESKKLLRTLMQEADEAYWKKWYEHRIVQMDDMDAFVAIRKDDNSFELSDVPAQKQKLYNSAACMPAAASLIVPAVRPG